MTGTMMMERQMNGMSGMPGMGSGPMMPGAAPALAPSMVMVPRCTFKMEKVAGGMKVTCICTDPAACAMMQNLCTMMAGGMCSFCCMMNGMMCCCCNMTMGMCKCEMTKDGCVMSCTSGDKMCEAMIQGCSDCMMACMKAGCMCCMMMGGTPVCCGTM
ncbi:MAG TPA: hypothetical protein VKE74_02840 [Gemmataceae bacterium]|nr:hypothetical protein [Gemmataceae bacterium]